MIRSICNYSYFLYMFSFIKSMIFKSINFLIFFLGLHICIFVRFQDTLSKVHCVNSYVIPRYNTHVFIKICFLVITFTFIYNPSNSRMEIWFLRLYLILFYMFTSISHISSNPSGMVVWTQIISHDSRNLRCYLLSFCICFLVPSHQDFFWMISKRFNVIQSSIPFPVLWTDCLEDGRAKRKRKTNFSNQIKVLRSVPITGFTCMDLLKEI